MKKFLFSLLFLAAIRLSAQQLNPTTTQAVLKVLVENDKKKPQVGQKVSFVSLKDGKEYAGTTNGEGNFSMLIPVGQKYTVKYKIFNATYSDHTIEMPAGAQPYTLEYTITATPPRTFTLNNVFFDSGKSTLRPGSDKELNDLAEYMNLKKTLVVEIAGHTDNVGDEEANQKLSEGRAEAVKQFLVKRGIAAERVMTKGYGDTQPVADNGTETGKQKNRRTEVRIVSE
jgi:outer membrane protein OmpA-like peptidoglycan-associated protein